MKTLKTLVFIASSVYLMGAAAQNTAQESSACPAGWAMTDKQLQGEWVGSINHQSESVRLVLGPHPEWQGMVKGSVERAGLASSHPMVGDLNNGTITLEESADGTHITGTWLGEASPASCGREIRGSFSASEDDAPQDFVIQKQP